MAIDFKSFDSGKRFRLVWMGTTPIRTEDGVTQPYEPFDASPRWVRGHGGMAHRLVSVDDYAAGLAAASLADLTEHARRRGCVECGCAKSDVLRCLLDGIASVPDFEEEEPAPESYISTTLDLDTLSRNELRDLASDYGLQVGGTKDELRARLDEALREPFEEE